MALLKLSIFLLLALAAVESIPATPSSLQKLHWAFSASNETSTTKEPVVEIMRYRPPEKIPCLSLGDRCLFSKLQCCKTKQLDSGELLDIDGFCYIFEGRCESRRNFPYYYRYVKLAKKLYKSIFERLNP